MEFSKLSEMIEDFLNSEKTRIEVMRLQELLRMRSFQIFIRSQLNEYREVVESAVVRTLEILRARCAAASDSSALIYFDALFLIGRLVAETGIGGGALLPDFAGCDIGIAMRFYELRAAGGRYSGLRACDENLEWIMRRTAPEFAEGVVGDAAPLLESGYIEQLRLPKVEPMGECLRVAQTTQERFREIAEPKVRFVGAGEKPPKELSIYDTEEYQNYIREQLKEANAMISQRLSELSE